MYVSAISIRLLLGRSIPAIRAIEQRMPVARAANTGVSSFIDTRGRTLVRSEIFVEDVLVVDLH